jgi:hypothetical protein
MLSSNNSTKLLDKEYSFENLKGNINVLANQLQDKSFNSPINLSTLNTTNKTASNSLNESIRETLSLANQSRWTFKSSPISEKLVRDNFNYTQAKQLLGSSIVNSLSSSNNI